MPARSMIRREGRSAPPGRRAARRAGWAPLGALGDLDDPPEGGGIANGEVGQHLAVDLDIRLLQALDEPSVGDTVQAGGRVDPDDPQRAHLALALLAVAGRIRERVKECLAGRLDEP